MIRTRELKALRIMKGYSLQEAAKMLDRTPSGYSHKEKGMTYFTDEEKIILAEKFDMNYDQFNRIFFDGKLKFNAS